MHAVKQTRLMTTLLTIGALGCASCLAAGAVRIEGQVQASGAPRAN